MKFTSPKRIEDLIVFLLKDGEENTIELLEKVRKIRKNTTKQAFYFALRKLKKEDIIIKYNKFVALSTLWIRSLQEFAERSARSYSLGVDAFSILALSNRESVSFLFRNSKSLDNFWGHAQSVLMYNTPQSEPIYSYDPHYWLFIARQEREQSLLEEIVGNKRQFLMTVGGNFYLDRFVKSFLNNDYLQYNIKKLFPLDNYYVTIIGDYIIEVFFDKSIASNIENIYSSSNVINDQVIRQLNGLLEEKSKHRIKISRDMAKVNKLKKKLSKDFYLLHKNKKIKKGLLQAP